MTGRPAGSLPKDASVTDPEFERRVYACSVELTPHIARIATRHSTSALLEAVVGHVRIGLVHGRQRKLLTRADVDTILARMRAGVTKE
ncbi:MAG TPA: hypothetical protein VGM84_15535 [Steroidobacteraceae bacterium]|jgi:hypothetical protein